MQEEKSEDEGRKELFIEEIVSSEETSDLSLHEVQFRCRSEINKGEGSNADEQFNNVPFYRIAVKKVQTGLEWEILRKYEDFQWLFKALKNHFPGSILPYFPSPSIQNYLENKTKLLHLKLERYMLAPRQQQLASFLTTICSSKQFGLAEQVQIFLLKGDDYLKRRSEMSEQLQSVRLESKSFSIYSFFTRGLSWFANNQEQKFDSSVDLLRIRFHLNNYSSQIAFLLQKLGNFANLKTEEMNWIGSTSEIDSVQILKAKFASSKPFNEILLSEIENKLVLRLVEQLKKEGQIQEQISDRIEAGKLIEYLRNVDENDQRISHFTSLIQKFDKTMLEQWPQYEQIWKEAVCEFDSKLRSIWTEYCEKMCKIWR